MTAGQKVLAGVLNCVLPSSSSVTKHNMSLFIRPLVFKREVSEVIPTGSLGAENVDVLST